MQKKMFYIVSIITSCLIMNQAYAQSSHESVSVPDTDYQGGANNFALRSNDGKFMLGVGGLLQEHNRFTYDLLARQVPGVNRTAARFNMSIPAARLKIYGHAFDPNLSYFFQGQFDQKDIGQLTAGLRDFYINAILEPTWAQVRVGKFTTPFSRHLMMSISQTQFARTHMASESNQIEHGPTAQRVRDNRDIGLMLHNGFHNEIEYALAVVTQGLIGRVGYNYGGIDGYEAVDFTGGDLRFGAGISAFLPTDYVSMPLDKFQGAFDVIAKYDGFAANAVLYYKYAKPQQPSTAKASHDWSAGLDLGYLIHKTCEPVARYSWMKDKEDHKHEITAGFNHYAFGHHLKSHIYTGVEMTNSKFSQVVAGLQFQFDI